MSALQISGRLERQQLLEITNIGSKPVDVGEEVLHPGVKYLAYLPDGARIIVDRQQVATFHLRPRTAEVEKTASGQIEFRFADE